MRQFDPLILPQAFGDAQANLIGCPLNLFELGQPSLEGSL